MIQDCYDPMRKYKTVKFRGSRYPEIDAQITEYINGRLSQVRFQNTHVTSPVDEMRGCTGAQLLN